MSKRDFGWLAVMRFILARVSSIKDDALFLRMLLAYVCVPVSIVLRLLTPTTLAMVTDSLCTVPGEPSYFFLFNLILVAYGLTWTAAQLMERLREFLMISIASRVTRLVVVDFVKHVLGLSLQFFAGQPAGALLSAIGQAGYAVPDILLGALFWLVPLCMEFAVISLVMAYKYGVLFPALVLGLFLCNIGFFLFSAKKNKQTQGQYTDAYEASFSQLADALINIETVIYFGNQDHEVEKIGNKFNCLENAEVKFYHSMQLEHVFRSVAMGVVLTIGSYVSARMVLAGELALGDFVAVNSYFMLMLSPLSILGSVIRDATAGLAHMQNAMNLLDGSTPASEQESALNLHFFDPLRIEFENVSFSYIPGKSVFHGLSFVMEPGMTTALVGATGSGKSTATKLLLRLYDPSHGAIKINNVDTKQLSLKNLASLFAVVPQHTAIFKASLRYNIKYGRMDASDDQVWTAISAAGLTDFVAGLPGGLDAELAAQGASLSGGERQRIAIARAILQRPQCFIFDEATSSLDANTERKVCQKLREISQGITTLIISHHLSTLSYADKIVVLQNGCVAEVGTHQELFNSRTLYYELWQKQFDDAIGLPQL